MVPDMMHNPRPEPEPEPERGQGQCRGSETGLRHAGQAERDAGIPRVPAYASLTSLISSGLFLK